ncbi:MAG TPA: Smr/MutS family protein [Gammaproteobacteria bacterium]
MDSGNDERSAFRQAMLGVTPLKRQNRVAPARKRPAATARLSRAARAAVLRDSLNGALVEQADGEIEFRRHGVRAETLRLLRRGRFAVADEIDLHGLTRSEAEEALKSFIAASVSLGHGCVRVVHGKGSRSGPGGPVLKHAVHEWLARCDDVLAFASAAHRHGGTGAVCVLLRRR